jgi:hypothetical protein
VSRRRIVAAATLIGLSFGAAVPASAYWTAAAPVTTTLAVARLGNPVVVVAVTGTVVTLTVSAPADGPAPTGYTVTYDAGPSRQNACAHLPAGGGDCVNDVGAFSAERHYTVTAELGDNWRRSISKTVFTDPPTVTVALKADSDTGIPGNGDTSNPTPMLVLTAPPGASPYDVNLEVDGTAVSTVHVLPADPPTREVTLPTLANGSHTIRAVAVYHGTTQSAPLSVTVLVGAVAAAHTASAEEQSPEPVDAPRSRSAQP